jgi:hypothetical protein
MLRIETGLVLLSLLIAFIYPSLGSRWFDWLEQRFSQLSRRRVLSVFLVGCSALALRAALLPVEPIPEPIVHDEFAYLLAADTYSQGKLTNPTHPMWVHFESFGIIQKPSYQCIAQPAQGMILALGKIIFGHPFWGVWLSASLMCASITWMLQGWLPPAWALLGGILAILRFGVFGYWANSYWGGAMGALGGALVLGALPRIKREQKSRDALLMALGLAILANNRPYEGLVFSLPIAAALLLWMFGRQRPGLSISLRRVLIPVFAVLLITGLGMSYYFWRVTGSASRMPYQVEREEYSVAPLLAWQHLNTRPVYHHSVIKKMYVDEELVGYTIFRSPVGVAMKAFWAWKFYLGPLFMLPFLLLIFVLPPGFSWGNISENTRFLLVTLVFMIFGCLLESFYSPHYSSPATGLMLALTLIAVRRLSNWGFSKPKGIFFRRAFVIIAALVFILRTSAVPFHIPLGDSVTPGWSELPPRSFGRASLEKRVQQFPGQQLVIVRYKPIHEPFEEWVYNDADIDHSKIVWAREMDSAENDRLRSYFSERQAWLLEADEKPPRLTAYPGSVSTALPENVSTEQR